LAFHGCEFPLKIGCREIGFDRDLGILENRSCKVTAPLILSLQRELYYAKVAQDPGANRGTAIELRLAQRQGLFELLSRLGKVGLDVVFIHRLFYELVRHIIMWRAQRDTRTQCGGATCQN
jgi:hypothetical protein